jgi:transcriptional regulator with XRE-family HTH domain
LPCYHPVIKRAQKPINPYYPKELRTLGDHIRKRRLDLGLFQKDVAKKLHTTTDTITNWEKNRVEPEFRFYPAIMDFLGYCPIQHPKTSGEKLELYRIHQGLSFKKLARLMSIDSGVLSRQIKRKMPSQYCQKKFEVFWQGILAHKNLCQVTREVRKIKHPHYPDEPKTLKEHILRKRLDLGLSQRELAEELNITKNAVNSWENGRSEPELRLYPKIMGFLGYCSIQYPKTLGEKLELYRTHQGLSYLKLGQMMGVDPAGLSRQMKKEKPTAFFQAKFEGFWKRCYEVM